MGRTGFGIGDRNFSWPFQPACPSLGLWSFVPTSPLPHWSYRAGTESSECGCDHSGILLAPGSSLVLPLWPLGIRAQWGAARIVWPDPRVLCSSQDASSHPLVTGKETVTKMRRCQLCYLFWSLCSPASFHCNDSHPIIGSH